MEADEIHRIDMILLDLIDLADAEIRNAKSKNFFSKDLAEAIGVVISLAYGRLGKNDK